MSPPPMVDQRGARVDRTPVLIRRTAVALVVIGIGVVYYVTSPHRSSVYDHTYRIANSLLKGRLDFDGEPPQWLERSIYEDRFYSPFPLGSVLTLVPLAALGDWGMVPDQAGWPSAAIVAAIAVACALFAIAMSRGYGASMAQSLLLGAWLTLGTWSWPNLAFGGSWQVALGFAMVGELGALYFTLADRRPFWAGCFFALAFGNRSELVILAPLFLLLLLRPFGSLEAHDRAARTRDAALFCLVPFLLGVSTLLYNYSRFDSFLDFGYTRIPGVVDEPWYRDGLFALSAIPRNANQMLLVGWMRVDGFPYLAPTRFGGSIFLASPLLVLLFRLRARSPWRLAIAWSALICVTFVLWCHGNPGGYQYSYRYAMVLLPWMLLILLETGSVRGSRLQTALIILSVAINAWGNHLFNWVEW